MDMLWQQGELVFGASKFTAEPPVISLKQFDPNDCGRLEYDADFDFRVAFFDALEGAARYAGALSQFLGRQFALLSSDTNKLAKQQHRFARMSGVCAFLNT